MNRTKNFFPLGPFIRKIPEKVEWQIATINPKGWVSNLDRASTLIQDNESPYTKNFRYRADKLEKRPGYSVMGALISGCDIMLIDQYFHWDGGDFLIAATPGGLFQFTAGAWALIPLAVADYPGGFAGTDSDFFVTEVVNNWFIFCNQVDPVGYWTGAGDAQRLSADCPPCRAMRSYGDRLVIGHTFEGVNRPYRVRWPVNGDITNWTGVGSGYTDSPFDESPDWIQQIEKMEDYCLVYKERSIFAGRRTGVATSPFSFTESLTNTGLLCKFSLVDLGDEHLFIGPDDAYSLTISNTKKLMSEKVRNYFFEYANPSEWDRVTGFFIEELDEWWIVLPFAGETYANTAIVYNVTRETWTMFGFGHYITVAGYWQRSASLTIDDLVGTIDEQAWKLDSRHSLAAYPINLLGLTNGAIVEIGDEFLDDAGVVIGAEWQSKDLQIQPGYIHTMGGVRIG